jgi:hypothetical protein
MTGASDDRDRFDELYEKLELLADLDDLSLGGEGGLATGVEIVADSLNHGPGDPLDAFDPLRDMTESTDLFDDLF